MVRCVLAGLSPFVFCANACPAHKRDAAKGNMHRYEFTEAKPGAGVSLIIFKQAKLAKIVTALIFRLATILP